MRTLTKTPWQIAVEVAHQRMRYGELIEGLESGAVLDALKRAIFNAVRDVVTESSEENVSSQSVADKDGQLPTPPGRG